jgi:hypothetical protein
MTFLQLIMQQGGAPAGTSGGMELTLLDLAIK